MHAFFFESADSYITDYSTNKQQQLPLCQAFCFGRVNALQVQILEAL